MKPPRSVTFGPLEVLQPAACMPHLSGKFRPDSRFDPSNWPVSEPVASVPQFSSPHRSAPPRGQIASRPADVHRLAGEDTFQQAKVTWGKGCVRAHTLGGRKVPAQWPCVQCCNANDEKLGNKCFACFNLLCCHVCFQQDLDCKG